MRIISGIFKGRIVLAPKEFELRPTTDMAKEGLFNVLNNEFDFSEIAVLDLFAGIGSISFECISRGCSDVVSVEMNAKHANFIKQTSKKLSISGHKILISEVRDFLKIANRPFDLIFADPPYNLPWLADLPNLIFSSKAVNEDSLIIVEHPGEYNFSSYDNFVKLKKYGKVHFSFFRKNVER